MGRSGAALSGELQACVQQPMLGLPSWGEVVEERYGVRTKTAATHATVAEEYLP